MPKLLTTALVAPLALGLCLSLSGCGGSSTSSTASSAASAASSVASSAASAASSAVSGATAPAAGTLAASCSQIDAVMEGNPDSDPAGTAKKLEDIKASVTTPDADLIEALAAAYTAIAGNPGVGADTPTGQQLTGALKSSATALGAACQMATTAPRPN